MRRRLRIPLGAVAAVGLATMPCPLAAQAFTPARGVGSLTFAWQLVDNTGHRMSDGFLLPQGQSVTTSLLLEAEYAVTDRLSAGLGIPYVFAKYTGDTPPISGLPHDSCRCWQSAFQDVTVAARYRLGGDTWAITPVFRYGRPSHDYDFVGEAVVGRNLQEAQLGALAGARLRFIPSATVQTGYTYAFVESPLENLSLDRSNGFIDVGYAVNRRLYVRGAGIWQRTHGGLRAGSLTGVPFAFPGELNTPERYAQRDRVQRTNYWQLGGGLAYSMGTMDVFLSYSSYVWGRDAHDGQVLGAGATWYFGLPN
jgi:hypothetical protein